MKQTTSGLNTSSFNGSLLKEKVKPSWPRNASQKTTSLPNKSTPTWELQSFDQHCLCTFWFGSHSLSLPASTSFTSGLHSVMLPVPNQVYRQSGTRFLDHACAQSFLTECIHSQVVYFNDLSSCNPFSLAKHHMCPHIHFSDFPAVT